MAEEANADSGSIRNAIRWGLFLAAVGTVGFRLPRVVQELRAWRDAVRLGDVSAAARGRTILLVDGLGLLIVLGIGLAVFYLLRPRAKNAP